MMSNCQSETLGDMGTGRELQDSLIEIENSLAVVLDLATQSPH